MKKIEFSDKSVLITGGTSGIGAETAVQFAQAGACVAITGRSEEKGDEMKKKLRRYGKQALYIEHDVTDPSSCRRAVEKTVASLGGIDVLFNNAGIIYRDRSVQETSWKEWQDTINTNLSGTFLMSKLTIPHLEGGGCIINNASYLGLVGAEGTAAYSAAKGGVVSLTKAMALDLAEAGIRVNCICPGSVDTPMLQQEMQEMGGRKKVQHLFEEKHPLGRIAEPSEIAALVLFLASGEAGFITGAAVPIDGGLTAK